MPVVSLFSAIVKFETPKSNSLMCKGKKGTQASTPKPRHSDTSMPTTSTTTFTTSRSSANSFSSDSLSLLRDSLRDPFILYPFPELSAATNHLLSPHCILRGVPAIVIHRRLRSDPASIAAILTSLCRTHHTSIARLLGASVPGDGRIYLVYEYISGATLADCLRNPRNPGYTPLSTWTSRVQIAADLAQGLEYIHHHSASGNVHNKINSTGVIITEPGLRAKICHFGAAELAGEGVGVRIDGSRGYIAPEVVAGERVSRKSDVFAFGVVMLELMCGAEAVKYRLMDKKIEMVSVVETAREAYGEEVEGRSGRVRRWVDKRVRDSFPTSVVEKMMWVALRCVEKEAEARPEMVWVAGMVSKMLLESVAWAEKVGALPDFSLSMAPR